MIVVVDYGLGNVRSIYAKIAQINEPVKISSNVEDIETADKLILPGVGAFDAGIDKIRTLGLFDTLNCEVLRRKKPILGICLGMQLFSKYSEEGTAKGLGYLEAETKRFCFDLPENFNIPHMGWNTISIARDSPLLDSIDNGSRFYFVHSYHLVCKYAENTIASTNYGYDFPSVVQNDNVFGVQFHPEKSHKQGIRILKNFVKL